MCLQMVEQPRWSAVREPLRLSAGWGATGQWREQQGRSGLGRIPTLALCRPLP